MASRSLLLLLGSSLIAFAAACGGKGTGRTADSRGAATSASRHTPTTVVGTPSLRAPDCSPAPNALCLIDTAITHSDADPPDLGPTSQWIIFGAAGDSIEISTTPPGSLTTSLGEERDSLHNTAAQFRHRVAVNGAVQVWLGLDNISDSVAYIMRLVDRGPPPPVVLRATGRTATLVLASKQQSDRYAIVPLSLVEGLRSLAPWTVALGTHKVALVGDSLYQLCKMPCARRDTVKLTPSSRNHSDSLRGSTGKMLAKQ